MPLVLHQLADPAGTPLLVVDAAERRHRETIASFVRRQGWTFAGLPTVCLINGQPVPVREWSHRKLRKRDEVVFLSRPLGGGSASGASSGKSIAAVVAMVALTALAPWAGGVIAGALGLGGAKSTAAGIVGALILAGGGLLLSAFMRPKAGGKSEKSEDLFSISADGNTARPLQPIPVGYGRRLVYPDFAAPPYSEFAGDSQYLYELLALGCGRYDVEEIRIDDTPIWNKTQGVLPSFAGSVAVEIKGPGEQVDLFPVNVVTASEVGGQRLPNPSTWIGGFIVNAAGTQAKTILLDFVWPGGSYTTYKDRVLWAHTGIEAQARQVNDAGVPTSGWFTILSKGYQFTKQSQIRVTERVTVPPGRYEVRVRRTDDEIDGQSLYGGKVRGANQVVWSALRAHIDGPQTFPHVTTIALRMQADATLSGFSSRKIGVIATRMVSVWNGSTWVEQPTRNPVWAALDIWSNPVYSAGLPLANVDLQTFASYAALYDSLGHTFDHVFTEPTSIQEAIETALRVGRASPAFVGDRLTMVRDEPRGLPTMLITDREMVRGSLSIVRNLQDEEWADGVVVEYLDETTWRLADVSSAPIGQTLSMPARVQVPGLTKRAQAVGVARHLAAVSRYRRRTVSCRVEMEGRLLKRGDLIAISSDLPQTWGQGGHVVAYNAATRQVTLSRPVEWQPSGNHYLEVRRRNGRPFGPVRVLRGGADDIAIFDALDLAAVEADQGITAAVAIARQPTEEACSFVFSAGEPRTYHGLVTRGTSSPDGRYMDIETVIDAPEVYDITEDGVPPPAPVPQFLEPSVPVITQITASMFQQGVAAMVRAGWEPPNGAALYVAQISYDGGETYGEVYRGSHPAFVVPCTPSPLKVRVRPLTADGREGPWSVVDVAAIEIVIENSWANIRLDIDDLKRDFREFIEYRPDLQDIADLAAEGHVIADAAEGKARAAIRQVQIAQATADYAKAVLGSQITAEYDLTEKTVSDNLSQIRGAVSAQATQIASVEATADKALAVLGSSIVAEYDNNNVTVSDNLSQVNAAISAQATQIGSVEATAEKALAVLGSEIVAQWESDGTTVSNIATELSTSVADIGGQVSAYANAITSLSAATSPTDVNTANFRMAVQTGPSGYSRIGMQARQGGTGSWRQASLFLDVPNAPGEPTRVVVDAEQFAVLGPSGATAPFVIDGGTTYVNNAMIRNLTADNITAGKLNAAQILQDGTLITELIAENALSNSEFVSADNEVYLTGEMTVLTLNWTGRPGARRLLQFVCDLYGQFVRTVGGSSVPTTSTIRLKRDGVTIAQATRPFGWTSFENFSPNTTPILSIGGNSVTLFAIDTTGGASSQYTVTVQANGDYSLFRVRDRSLRLDELRR